MWSFYPSYPHFPLSSLWMSVNLLDSLTDWRMTSGWVRLISCCFSGFDWLRLAFEFHHIFAQTKLKQSRPDNFPFWAYPALFLPSFPFIQEKKIAIPFKFFEWQQYPKRHGYRTLSELKQKAKLTQKEASAKKWNKNWEYLVWCWQFFWGGNLPWKTTLAWDFSWKWCSKSTNTQILQNIFFYAWGTQVVAYIQGSFLVPFVYRISVISETFLLCYSSITFPFGSHLSFWENTRKVLKGRAAKYVIIALHILT